MIRSPSQQDFPQEVVPYRQKKRPVDWDNCFPCTQPLELEIGSGLGEFLVRKARECPDRNFIGVEQDGKRVKKTLRKISRLKEETFIDNIRLLQVDAVMALERLFAMHSISRVYSLFPCPWPKKRHIKHRLFSGEFLRLLNSRMLDGGECQVVTDFLPYRDWVLEQSEGTGFRVISRNMRSRFDTKYERKWREQGQDVFFELSLIKEDHRVVPVKTDVDLPVYFARDLSPETFRMVNATGLTTIIFKEFLFDKKRRKAMVRLLVAEPSLTQHVWVGVQEIPQGWQVALAEGQPVIPTEGVALAIRRVYEHIQKG